MRLHIPEIAPWKISLGSCVLFTPSAGPDGAYRRPHVGFCPKFPVLVYFILFYFNARVRAFLMRVLSDRTQLKWQFNWVGQSVQYELTGGSVYFSPVLSFYTRTLLDTHLFNDRLTRVHLARGDWDVEWPKCIRRHWDVKPTPRVSYCLWAY